MPWAAAGVPKWAQGEKAEQRFLVGLAAWGMGLLLPKAPSAVNTGCLSDLFCLQAPP